MFRKCVLFLLVILGLTENSFAIPPDIWVNNHTKKSMLLIHKRRPNISIPAQQITKIASGHVRLICGMDKDMPKRCANDLVDASSSELIARIIIDREDGLQIPAYWVSNAYNVKITDPAQIDIESK